MNAHRARTFVESRRYLENASIVSTSRQSIWKCMLLRIRAYHLLVDSNMAVRSFLSDNLNKSFDASVEMDSRVHFADSEIRNPDHLVQ